MLTLQFGGLIAAIYLGINGNRLAWRSRDWTNARQFKDTQSRWAIWGKVSFALLLVLEMISLALLAYMIYFIMGVFAMREP